MDKLYLVLAAVAVIAAVVAAIVIIILKKKKFRGSDYSIPVVDLSDTSKEGYLYELSVVDNSKDYVAHPDSVLLKNGNILTVYPAGHGKGAIKNKISTDGGVTWREEIRNTPASWEKSLETPTIYRLEFTDGKTPDKLILISANSKWPGMTTPGGFNSSVSCDEGQTWTEFRRFFDLESDFGVIPIVAMSSLTQLKENGKFVDKWMGLFHDSHFYNYRTILTFDEEGKEHWSTPEKYFSAYRETEKKAGMCEVEIIRSDMGKGDELCLITRSNKKTINSLISFSSDEGKTWSEPKEAPASLNGERHKADYTPDGRLFISFRSIERGKKARKTATDTKRKGWMSEGLVAWVGTFDDLKKGREGQYRIKLAHIYKEGQTIPEYDAEADTGYCGNVVLSDGTIMTSSYGKYNPNDKASDGKTLKTSICSKLIRLEDTDRIVEDMMSKQ